MSPIELVCIAMLSRGCKYTFLSICAKLDTRDPPSSQDTGNVCQSSKHEQPFPRARDLRRSEYCSDLAHSNKNIPTQKCFSIQTKNSKKNNNNNFPNENNLTSKDFLRPNMFYAIPSTNCKDVLFLMLWYFLSILNQPLFFIFREISVLFMPILPLFSFFL